MKIQDLAIIFVVIIIPISLILSVFTQYQMKAINTQTQYDTILTSATHDAIKAFQLNSVNSTTSDLADSKIRDLEASVTTFKNSLKSSFRMNGYTEEELNSYIPALVYTLYDGFYIYSPYENINHRYEIKTDDKGEEIKNAYTGEPEYVTDASDNKIPIDDNGEKLYGLKPYINYSCRYVKGNIDVVITYALDNYIKVQGNIGNEYVNKSGYLIEGITDDGNTITYNGVTIGKEHLKENIGSVLYSYAKVNGTKYYLREDTEEIIYFLNGIPVVQYGKENPQYISLKNLIQNNDSAQQYYREAYEFTEWFKDTGLTNLQYSDAYDEIIDDGGNISIDKIWGSDTRNIFEFNTSKNIENETSNFNQHRLAIIRHKIEVNLAVAIANYNDQFGGTNEFQIPELKEDEWDYITHNISLISFLQGLPMGERTYNGYTIVTNSESKEVVIEQNIYILGTDGTYHKIGDNSLADGTISIDDRQYGVYDDISARSAGRLNLDFKKSSMTNSSTVETIYYYPLKEYNASYDSIVMQNNVTTYDDIYEYVDGQSNTLKEAFYTALGRERYGMYRTSNQTEQQYSVLVVGMGTDTTNRETQTRDITNTLNKESNIKATYIYGNGGSDTDVITLTNYIIDNKENYNLIIIHGFVWPLKINSTTLQEISNETNLITISNDATGLPMMQPGSATSSSTTVVPQITDLGNEKLGNISITGINDSQAYFKFNNDVEVFYTGTYSGDITGEYDLIGCWKHEDYKWIHSQVSLSTTNHMNLLKELVKYALDI